MDFPNTSTAIRQLAVDLTLYLRGKITNTKTRVEWTDQNKALLDRFFDGSTCHRNFTASEAGAEFLWDFTAYVPYRGLLLVAESEYDTKHERIAEDFDKLLYSNAPLKLMICRIDKRHDTQEAAEQEAQQIQSMLLENVQQNCKNYSGGDTVIVYCVWWAADDNRNRDFAYLLQIDGEPQYRDATGKSFEALE